MPLVSTGAEEMFLSATCPEKAGPTTVGRALSATLSCFHMRSSERTELNPTGEVEGEKVWEKVWQQAYIVCVWAWLVHWFVDTANRQGASYSERVDVRLVWGRRWVNVCWHIDWAFHFLGLCNPDRFVWFWCSLCDVCVERNSSSYM